MRQSPTPPAEPTEASPFRTLACARFAELFAALQQKTGRLVPQRAAFSPAQAKDILPYVSILEIKEPRLALVRLVGTAIVNRTHVNNTGGNMLDVLPPEFREESWRHFCRLLEMPCGCALLSEEDYGHVSVLVEVASFPFADREGVPRFVVSLSIEVDREDLLMRGDQAMHISQTRGYRYIDIGAGL